VSLEYYKASEAGTARRGALEKLAK
jgi:hypothetical protein